ncbi:hypothetical protein D3C87_2031160 [compost metagenome]
MVAMPHARAISAPLMASGTDTMMTRGSRTDSNWMASTRKMMASASAKVAYRALPSVTNWRASPMKS